MQTQHIHRWSVITMLLTALASASLALAQEEQNPMRFDFGEGPTADGYVQVTPDMVYSPERGYGFEGKPSLRGVEGGEDPLTGDAITGEEPFFFSVRLPEGAYNVTLTLGAPGLESQMAVQAESRRLMLKDVAVSADRPAKRTFTVRIFTTALPAEGEMRLTPREVGILNYDDKLTLEFNGENPSVSSMEIEPAPRATTVFLAGDSTVTDQPDEPWSAWGAMLPRFFEPGVAVANYASSGRALRSFRAERRLEKILGTMKPGDYVFIQFGHNDQSKEKVDRYTPPDAYKANLRRFVEDVRAKQATPVLFTPVVRRRFNDEGQFYDVHGAYPDLVREVAMETESTLVDMHRLSEQLLIEYGPERSKELFLWLDPHEHDNYPDGLTDNTHFSPRGAEKMAHLAAEGLSSTELPITRLIRMTDRRR